MPPQPNVLHALYCVSLTFSVITSQKLFTSSSSHEYGLGVKYLQRSQQGFIDGHIFINSTAASTLMCKNKYSNRGYLPSFSHRPPPMLYTFPGSGNTWCRLLIERATGVFTGSLFNDSSLLETCPGEIACDWSVSVVKTHTHYNTFSALYDGSFYSEGDKCKRGNVTRFTRAILVIRDPYDSIWSEYQRRVSGSHVEGVSRADFGWSRWRANAAYLSHRYLEMWRIHYTAIFKTYKSNDVIVVRYEDLKNKQTRVSALREMVKFLGLHASDDRLLCAFALADSREARRVVDESKSVTKHEAYTPNLVCKMWKLFGNYANSFGYAPRNRLNCSSLAYKPIRDVVVGDNGEYPVGNTTSSSATATAPAASSGTENDPGNSRRGGPLGEGDKMMSRINNADTSSSTGGSSGSGGGGRGRGGKKGKNRHGGRGNSRR